MDGNILDLLVSPEAWVALVTLAVMEIVLGIDNIVFITILTSRLPVERQPGARRLGIGLALISRLGLLFGLSWIMGLTAPLFEVLGQEISGRDLILLGGGLFLIGKATHEIYENIEHPREEEQETKADAKRVGNQFALIMVQIIFLDVVFSLDSVITAVGMAQSLAIMVAAMVLAVGVMMAFAGPVGDFVQENNSVKVLALSFLVLIGVLLLADGLGQHVSKGYVYFAMGFAMMVELVNMRRRRKALKARALAAASSAGGADDGGT